MAAHRENKWLLLTTALLLFMVVYQYYLFPAMLSWGATSTEFERVLPGDEFVPGKGYKNTLAVTVKATPAQIWPWIAQMGLHKGGFYSYTRLENLFGCQLKNANFIHPEWQHPQAGTIEPVCRSQEGKPNSGWLLAVVEKQKCLVWRGLNNVPWMMGIYIDSVDEHTSRLITRQQFSYPGKWTGNWWLEKLWFGWAHCVMQRGMINGIKKRVQTPRPRAFSTKS